MAVLLTGKPVADALSADTRTRAEALLSRGVQPRLVLLRCGDTEADGAYIRGAVKRAALCGVAAGATHPARGCLRRCGGGGYRRRQP